MNLGAVSPPVFPASNTECAPGCTVATCSCIKSDVYWSSSTYQFFPQTAWYVRFNVGRVDAVDKTLNNYVPPGRCGVAPELTIRPFDLLIL